MKQFKAGYIVDTISNLITDNFKSFNYFNENENNDINKVKGLLQNQERHDRLQLLEFLVRQILIKLHLIQVEEVLTPTEVLDLVS